MIARFSTVAGELGAADAERDVRGFADLVGTAHRTLVSRGPTRRKLQNTIGEKHGRKD